MLASYELIGLTNDIARIPNPKQVKKTLELTLE